MRSFKLAQRFKNISIAKKLYFTVGTMALLIGIELLSLLFCLNTLSSVRAYVGGEGLWSKAQKDAVFHLYRYGVSRDPADYRLFQEFMKVPVGDGEARRELLKPHPDIQIVRQGFLKGRNHPDDIEGLINLFEKLSETYYIGKAIAIWGEAEPIMIQLMSVSNNLKREIDSGASSQARIASLFASIAPLNQRLTALEDQFSYTLGEGSRWLEHMVLRLLFFIALTVETTGLLLTVSISRSMQKSLGEIIRAARSLAVGNYNSRAKRFSGDEIGLLADAFNLMASRLEHSMATLQCEVSERERAEAELRRAFARLDQHVNNTPLAVIEWEQDHAAGEPPRVRRWTGRAPSIFGWTQSEVLGQSAEALGLIHAGDAVRLTGAGQNLSERPHPYNGLIRCYTRERRALYYHWYSSALHPEGNGKITVLSLVEDVTDQLATLDHVYRLAHHDTLTGLPNRVLLHDRLNQALTGARRCGHGVGVMMLDLDRFKNINDTLGHAIGDELLRSVAARLGARLRGSDTLARLGGDEFIVIQPDATDRASVASVAQKLLDTFAEPFLVRDNRIDIGVSIGIAICPDDATEPDELLRNADIALYRAKREGRGQYRCYSAEMDMELRATHGLETGLRQALEHGTLELFYQPTFSVESGRIQGVEALTRWPHPEGGYVAPASFIPVAETSGLIVPLGEWALDQACRQARTWNAMGRRIRVAVNVSPVQLRQPGFADVVGRALDRCNLVASMLELEVTESVFLDPSMAAITKTLHAVAEMGVRLAIDDFGTGFSRAR